MIPRISILSVVFALLGNVVAEVAPEITTVTDGYNLVAKIPCIGCPYLYQDTSKGSDEPWITKEDNSALLLNISLPYDSAYLSINNAPILTTSKVLPRVFVNQLLLDTSVEDLSQLIASNQLDNLGAVFGASYSYSLRHIKDSPNALLLHFDIMELWTDLTTPATTVILDDEKQKILEVLLLQRPLLSAGDPGSAYEIIRTSLIPRPAEPNSVKGPVKVSMWFRDWDAHGKKGTASHIVNSASSSFVSYISSGVWSLLIFIVAVLALFVVVCLFVILACGWHKDDYEQAQSGKRRSSGKGSGGGWGDVEAARRFRSPEELGLRGSGRVVGVGKSD